MSSFAYLNNLFSLSFEGAIIILSTFRVEQTFLILLYVFGAKNPLSKVTAKTFRLYLFFNRCKVYVLSFPPLYAKTTS